jgi:membrane-associated protease RseP (regulator of RpoE activity)
MASDGLNPANNAAYPAGTPCSNCGAQMPPDLRFCRACGSRLGEDVAEYTETVRLQNAPRSAPNPYAPGNPYAFGAGPQGPQAFAPAAAQQMQWTHKKKRKFSGMTWLFIGLLMFFLVAGVFTAVMRQPNRVGVISASVPQAFVGVDNFRDAENGGVTFNSIESPGAPADKAGLVGGDVITSFDGHPVNNRREMMDLLRQTPIGKLVEVVYTRDGETRKTQLTPITRQEARQLELAFDRRAAGIGRFGYDDDETERVPVPGTKIYGVRLDDISPSLPADMAGIKNGDIVIEFSGTPIRTPEELRARVRRALPYETVTVVVMRGGERQEIPVKMGRQ